MIGKRYVDKALWTWHFSQCSNSCSWLRSCRPRLKCTGFPIGQRNEVRVVFTERGAIAEYVGQSQKIFPEAGRRSIARRVTPPGHRETPGAVRESF